MINIIIGFSRAKEPTIIGRMIRWFENTDYTHVYLLTDHLVPAKVVLHADVVNVHFISEKNFLEKSEVMHQYIISLNEEEMAKFLTMALDLIGKPYSYKQLFIIAFNRIMKWWSLGFRLRYHDGANSLICSELIERFLLEIKGFKITHSPDAVTPKDIKQICDELGLQKLT